MSDSQIQLEDLIVGILVKQFPEWNGRREEAVRFVREPQNAEALSEMLRSVADVPQGFPPTQNSSSGLKRLAMLMLALLIGGAIGVYAGTTSALAVWGNGVKEVDPEPRSVPPVSPGVPQSEIDAEIQKLQGSWERESATERVVKRIEGRTSVVTFYSRSSNEVTSQGRTEFNVCKVGDEWRFVYKIAFEKGKHSGRTFRSQYTYRFDEGNEVFHELVKTPYKWRKVKDSDYSEFER